MLTRVDEFVGMLDMVRVKRCAVFLLNVCEVCISITSVQFVICITLS